ncbi:golgin subfamily A member 6-like protein 25 [Lethenteron reissneri]|uniref:golgin subfamily A member 6-like protein 25 n=1 Tax=Lethenteron reissneri TaxID=7753 RepID=UPI002AB6CBCF|nr:golgin subfamily A member 6-like protein 25 [Lethenteron reissneri]
MSARGGYLIRPWSSTDPGTQLTRPCSYKSSGPGALGAAPLALLGPDKDSEPGEFQGLFCRSSVFNERRRRCPHPPRLPRPKWLTVVVEEEETPVEELLVQEEETLVEELVVQEEEILVEELVVQEEETLLEELVVQEEETLVEELVVQKEETLVEELVVQEEETLVQELVVQEEEEMRGETEELWTKEQEDEMVVQVEETLVEKMVEKEMTRKEDQVMMQEEKRKRGSLARIGRTIRSLLRLVLLCGSRSTTQ